MVTSPFNATSPIPPTLMSHAFSMSSPPPPPPQQTQAMMSEQMMPHNYLVGSDAGGGSDLRYDLRYAQSSFNAPYGNNGQYNNLQDAGGVDHAAKLYRNAATLCDATCTWSGQLPPRNYKNPMYSCKVFVGGVPWDITESTT